MCPNASNTSEHPSCLQDFPREPVLVADDGSVEIPDEDGNLNIDGSLVWTCDGDSSNPEGVAASSPQFSYQPPEKVPAMKRREQVGTKIYNSNDEVKPLSSD